MFNTMMRTSNNTTAQLLTTKLSSVLNDALPDSKSAIFQQYQLTILIAFIILCTGFIILTLFVLIFVLLQTRRQKTNSRRSIPWDGDDVSMFECMRNQQGKFGQNNRDTTTNHLHGNPIEHPLNNNSVEPMPLYYECTTLPHPITNTPTTHNFASFIADDLSDDLLYEMALAMDPNDIKIDQQGHEEEQCLSQKLSQLSASEATDVDDHLQSKRPLPVETSTVPKRRKIEDDPVKDNIPHYLSADHPNFRQLLQSMLSTTANSISMQDLQTIAVCLRQITMLDLQKFLWNTYLQSGTGELAKEEQHHGHLELLLWPTEVKLMVMREQESERIDVNQMNHRAYLAYAHRTLHELHDRQTQYQRQLDVPKNVLRHFFTAEMEQAIRQFVEQQEMIFVRLDYESKMAIVRYDYRDQLLELKYHQLKPNKSQVDLFANLVRMKQEKEKNKYKVELLKQRLRHGYLPETLHSLQLPLPFSSSLEKITDPNVRLDLLDRHTKTVEQTRLEAAQFYIRTAEVQIQECQLQFDQEIAQMSAPEQPFSQPMVQLVERRFQSIDERLEYLYKLKIRFLEAQINRRK